MTDPSKRPLTFPKWHIPYLEKHKIQELFCEIARELLIQKPDDHILFMKQILQQAAAGISVCRVVLLSSPKVNRIAIAEDMAKLTQQMVITSNDLKAFMSLATTTTSAKPTNIAKALACMVRNQNAANSGWILADCINNDQEAKALLKLGVLPTHVLNLVTPFQPKLDNLLYCDVPENWPQLRRNLFGLREVFSKQLREISLDDKSIADVALDCVEICKRRAAVKTVRPRVVLLGPRGSGRKTQARLLVQLLGLVHVNFECLLCQAWNTESELGEQLRDCKKEVCFHSELLCQIVNKRILQKDCLEKGWILTGYPYTVTDFQFLDSLQTPPNRVIVVDSDLSICKERIRYRQRNVYTGSVTNLMPSKETALEDIDKKTDVTSRGVLNLVSNPGRKVLKKHPKDTCELIQAEHDFYCQKYGSIKKYCGNTLMVVNGEQSQRAVHECILGYLVGGNPVGPPRKAFGTEIPEVCSCDCVNMPSKVTKAYTMSV